MREIFAPLLLAQLLLAPGLAFAQLTETEEAFVQKCHDNTRPEKNQLSAATALDCVRRLNAGDAALLHKIQNEDSWTGGNAERPRALDIVSYNNALIDLKNIVTSDTGLYLVTHLTRVFKGPPCPLCAMNLGPMPENIFEWVGKEADSRLADVKKSVRTWEALGGIRTRSLSSAAYGYNMEKWNSQPMLQRYQSLSSWAEKETNLLLIIHGEKRTLWSRFVNDKPDPQLLAVLREDLDVMENIPALRKLQKLESALGAKSEEKKPAERTPEEKKSEEVAAAAKRAAELKNLSDAGRSARLREMFDRDGQRKEGLDGPDSPVPPGKPEAAAARRLNRTEIADLAGRLLTADDDGNLRGPIAAELRGTKAGGEILGFYKDPQYAKAGTNRLNLNFEKRPSGQFGGWFPARKAMAFNSDLVNEWMRRQSPPVAPEQLFEGDPDENPHLRGLAQYLSPTFVHEATHQRQFARAAEKGIDYKAILGTRITPANFEKETEAFSMDGSFMAEKLLQHGPAYLAKLDPFDKANAELFIEKGVTGMRLANHRNYLHLDSFEGSASREFDEAGALARELRDLETRYNAGPGTLTDEEDARMWELKTAMNTRYKWYKTIYADSAASAEKINGWREEIRNKLFPSRTLDSTAPPGLL